MTITIATSKQLLLRILASPYLVVSSVEVTKKMSCRLQNTADHIPDTGGVLSLSSPSELLRSLLADVGLVSEFAQCTHSLASLSAECACGESSSC